MQCAQNPNIETAVMSKNTADAVRDPGRRKLARYDVALPFITRGMNVAGNKVNEVVVPAVHPRPEAEAACNFGKVAIVGETDEAGAAHLPKSEKCKRKDSRNTCALRSLGHRHHVSEVSRDTVQPTEPDPDSICRCFATLPQGVQSSYHSQVPRIASICVNPAV